MCFPFIYLNSNYPFNQLRLLQYLITPFNPLLPFLCHFVAMNAAQERADFMNECSLSEFQPVAGFSTGLLVSDMPFWRTVPGFEKMVATFGSLGIALVEVPQNARAFDTAAWQEVFAHFDIAGCAASCPEDAVLVNACVQNRRLVLLAPGCADSSYLKFAHLAGSSFFCISRSCSDSDVVRALQQRFAGS